MMKINTKRAILATLAISSWHICAISAQDTTADGQTTSVDKRSDPGQATTATRAQDVYVDSLRVNKVAGKATSDGFVDIYIYGPNTGSHVERDGPGSLIFHERHIPVTDKQWSAAISPPLRETISAYYQVNLNQTWAAGHTESEHAQNGLDLFRVNTGPECGTLMSASFAADTLHFAGQEKSLLAIDGYACNTAAVTMIVSGERGEVLKTTTKVVNGEWEAGKDMSIDSGTYTVAIYGDNNDKLTQGTILAPTNTGSVDASSLRQSISAKGGCFITGTASTSVVACLVPSSYTGSTDFTQLVHKYRSFRPSPGGTQTIDVEPNLAPASEAPKFRIRIIAGGPRGIGPGEYRLLLMEGTAAHAVLATATVVLTP